MIGHNHPPALEAHSLHIAELLELANGIVAIETQEQHDTAEALLDDIKKAKKAADDSRAAEKKPHLDAGKEVDDAYRPALAQADVAAKHIKAVSLPFREAQQVERDALAAKLRKEAEEALEAAQAALKSDDLGERAIAEIDLKTARIVTAQAKKLDRAKSGLRARWEAEIVDKRAALNHYIKRDPQSFTDLIQTLADRDALGVRPAVPGIEYHERKVAI